jgi:hypothetical protein
VMIRVGVNIILGSSNIISCIIDPHDVMSVQPFIFEMNAGHIEDIVLSLCSNGTNGTNIIQVVFNSG